jgi:hypothetical protein
VLAQKKTRKSLHKAKNVSEPNQTTRSNSTLMATWSRLVHKTEKLADWKTLEADREDSVSSLNCSKAFTSRTRLSSISPLRSNATFPIPLPASFGFFRPLLPGSGSSNVAESPFSKESLGRRWTAVKRRMFSRSAANSSCNFFTKSGEKNLDQNSVFGQKN